MPPTCRVDRHPKAADIALALVAGDSLRDIAGRFKVSKSALGRHRKHLGGTALVKRVEALREVEAMTLTEEIASLKRDAHRLKQKAEASGDLRCALAAVKELSDIVLRLEELMPTGATEAPVLVSFVFPDSGLHTNDPNKSSFENAADSWQRGAGVPATGRTSLGADSAIPPDDEAAR